MLIFILLLLFFICCFFFFVFHSHFLFNIIPQTSMDYSQVFRPILHFHFHFSTIPLSSDHKRYGFEWTFFTHRHFLPYAPSRHFWHSRHFGTTCFYQGFTGSWQLLFWKLQGSYCSSKHTPSPSVWFTVIHNLLYIWSLYLCMSILQKFYLWWKLW